MAVLTVSTHLKTKPLSLLRCLLASESVNSILSSILPEVHCLSYDILELKKKKTSIKTFTKMSQSIYFFGILQ